MNLVAFSLPSHPDWSLIRLQATDALPDAYVRPSIHLCLLLDVSASMEDEQRLVNVKHSLQHLLGLLTPDDRISLVTFSNTARVVLHQAFLNDIEALRMTLMCLQTESNTNLGAGLAEANRVLMRDPRQKQCVLLLTDGFATCGVMDVQELLARTEPLTESSVFHVIGYGEDHHANLLSRMASVGGGSYHVVRSLEDVAIVIGDVIGGLVSCAFQQVTLTLPACEIKTRYKVSWSETIADHAPTVEVMIGDLMMHGEAIVLARLPVGSSVHVDALNRVSGVMTTFWAHVIRTDDVSLCATGAAHWLRWKVVSIMETVSHHLETVGGDHVYETYHQQRISSCLTEIKNTMANCADHHTALWDLLIHELELCQHMLDKKGSSVLLRQHGATLSMMRGLSARTASANEDTLPNMQPVLSRAFSNATQLDWSEMMSQVGDTIQGTQPSFVQPRVEFPPCPPSLGRHNALPRSFYNGSFMQHYSSDNIQETQDM